VRERVQAYAPACAHMRPLAPAHSCAVERVRGCAYVGVCAPTCAYGLVSVKLCARSCVCELGCVCVRAHACACAMCMCARAGVGLSARGCSVDVCCVWWWVVWCVCLHVRGVFFGRADRVLCVVALGQCVCMVLLECCMSV
jgi:hypothetical protein